MNDDETQAAASTAEPLAPTTFLIVDDDRVLRDRLARAVRDRGHEVETASGLAEAKEVAARFRPRRAVVDLRMPDGSGLELVRALRALDAARIAPIFVFSGDDPGLDNLEGLLGKRLALVGDRVADHVGWQVIDGPDHTFTPLWAQAQLSAALEQLLLPRFWRGSAP